MSDRAFVSYARDDQDFVLQLGNGLKERGVFLWLDQWDIPAGGNWDQAIDQGLHACGRFLIVLSPAAVASQQVRGELQVALDEGKAIVPLLYKDCAVPRMLRLIQHIDFTAADGVPAGLVDEVAHALGQVPAGPDLPPQAEVAASQSGGRAKWPFAAAAILLVLLVGGGWYALQPASKAARSDDAVVSRPDESKDAVYPGRLQVSANVDNARVLLDGVEAGRARRSAPLFLTGIKPGGHRVSVIAAGYEQQEQIVNVSGSGWSMAEFMLSPRFPD